MLIIILYIKQLKYLYLRTIEIVEHHKSSTSLVIKFEFLIIIYLTENSNQSPTTPLSASTNNLREIVNIYNNFHISI